MIVFAMVSIVLLFGVFMKLNLENTFAEGNEDEVVVFEADGARYVSFFADGEKLIVKTDAHTVGEALERAGIELNEGDTVEADFDTGVITDVTTGESFNANAFPEFIKNIMACGGLVGYTGSELKA